MEACKENKVKRVVVTSSIAASINQRPENHKEMYTEEDYSDPEACEAYEKSKTLAEEAVWKFQKEECPELEVVTILPGFVLGPNLVKCSFTSGDVMTNMITGKMFRMPHIQYPLVDVRDVAFAHLQGIKVPEARNQRFLTSSTSLWFNQIGEIIHAEFPNRFTFSNAEAKYCMVWMMSCFNSDVKRVAAIWGRIQQVDGSKAERVLGFKYMSHNKSLHDMVDALYATGYIPQ